MKVSLKRVLSLLTVLLFMFFIASCGEEEVAKYTVTFDMAGSSENTTLEVEDGQKVAKPENPVWENHAFKGWFTTSSYETEFNFDSVIKSNTTVYAKWTENVEVRVYSVSNPEFITLFNAAKQGSTNKETEFMTLTNDYLVGDDNDFKCAPSVSFVDYNTVSKTMEPTTVDSWTYVVKVCEKGSSIELTSASELIDSINTTACSINFGDAAVGKSFTISVQPEGLTDKQKQNISSYTVSYEVKVVDAYNAYTAKELSVIDDGSRYSIFAKDCNAGWATFKANNGIDVNYKPNGVVLHSNMNITTNDVPSELFLDSSFVSKQDSDYKEALGSMTDEESIYFRSFNVGDTFNLYGNYFTIDASSIPLVVRENDPLEVHKSGTSVISHANLFKFVTRYEDDSEEDKTKAGTMLSNANINDVRFIGNSPKAEDTSAGGGLILFKCSGPSMKFENNIAARAFITYLFEYMAFNPSSINKCKAYDAFNSFIYNWGCDVTVSDSEFVGCGGPIIISDHVDDSEPDGGFPSKTTVTNTKLESYTAGTETWYATVGATAMVPQIKQLDAILNAFGRSFLYTDENEATRTFFNIVAVNKSASAQSLTGSEVKGDIIINGYDFNYGANDQTTAYFFHQVFQLGAPTFETNAGGIGYFDGTNFNDMTGTPHSATNPNTLGLLQGDYITLYFSGMAIVFQYGVVGQTH